MSFDQEINNTYKSLPNSNNFRTQKTVNFTMPQSTSKITIPINNGLASTSISSMNTQQQNNITSTNATTTTINTEEFAKLDALLEDLLAEVEQPILLNKEGVISSNSWNENSLSKKRINCYNDGLNMNNNNNNNKENFKMHSSRHLTNGSEDLERSVDWLNEQKERLKSRKELVNSYSSKHNPVSMITKSNEIEDPHNYRKVNSKLDYYVTNSNNGGGGGQYHSKEFN